MMFVALLSAIVAAYAVLLVAIRLVMWCGQDRNRRLGRLARRGLA